MLFVDLGIGDLAIRIELTSTLLGIWVPRPHVGALPSCQELREVLGHYRWLQTTRRATRSPSPLGAPTTTARSMAGARPCSSDLCPAITFGFVVATSLHQERERGIDMRAGYCLLIDRVIERWGRMILLWLNRMVQCPKGKD